MKVERVPIAEVPVPVEVVQLHMIVAVRSKCGIPAIKLSERFVKVESDGPAVNLVVYADGEVIWIPPVDIKVKTYEDKLIVRIIKM